LATKTDGTLWSWGNNIFGTLGLGNQVYRSSPVQVGSATNWNLIKSGYYTTMATKTDGPLWVWGFNKLGQLGLNDISNRLSPVQLGSSTWSKIASGYTDRSGGIKTDGTLWTWGHNFAGSLGSNISTDDFYRSSPVQIGTGTTWSKIEAGAYVFMGIIG
jgi:alpha-tubulin suppressor-like RCC1 family protein